MRTTLDLPIDLIREAMQITNAKTKTEAIRIALVRLIEDNRRKKLLTYKGRVDLQIDLDALRNRSSNG